MKARIRHRLLVAVAFLQAFSLGEILPTVHDVIADDQIKGVKQAEAGKTDTQASVAAANALSQAFRAASARMLPSVVTIRARIRRNNRENGLDSRYDEVLEGEEHDNFDTVGSGVIISADGLVITNNHVVAQATDVQIELYNGRRIAAKDVRTDESSDLAILRAVTDKKLQAAEVADSDELMAGDWVLAIGSPFEQQASVSAGIISGKGRSLGGLVAGQFLQTDAAVNPGNSGGPLVNLEGKLIGINTAISSQNGMFNGVGFAIPINRAFWITNELVEHGKVRRALLGASLAPIPQEIMDRLDAENAFGAYVANLIPGRPADKSGVKIGDVVIEFAGQRVENERALPEIVEQCPVGKPLKMVVMRESQRVEITVELIPRTEANVRGRR